MLRCYNKQSLGRRQQSRTKEGAWAKSAHCRGRRDLTWLSNLISVVRFGRRGLRFPPLVPPHGLRLAASTAPRPGCTPSFPGIAFSPITLVLGSASASIFT